MELLRGRGGDTERDGEKRKGRKGECVRGDVRRGRGTCGWMRRSLIYLPCERVQPSQSCNNIKRKRRITATVGLRTCFRG